MTLFNGKYRIESTRLPSYNYSSQGWYYVTLCMKYRDPVFGKVINRAMEYTAIGQVARQCWLDIPDSIFPVFLEAYRVYIDSHIISLYLEVCVWNELIGCTLR